MQVHKLLRDEAESDRAHHGPVGGPPSRGLGRRGSHELAACHGSHGRSGARRNPARHRLVALEPRI